MSLAVRQTESIRLNGVLSRLKSRARRLQLSASEGIGLAAAATASQMGLTRVVRRIAKGQPAFEPFSHTATNLIWFGAPAVAAMVASKRRGSGNPVRDLGLTPKFSDVLIIPALVQLAGLLASAGSAYVSSKLNAKASETITPEPSLARLPGPPTRLVGLMAPLTEEVIHRGLLMSGLEAVMPRPAATLAQAAIFGFLHSGLIQRVGFNPLPTVQAGAVALSLGAGVQVTGRLFPSVITHAALNLIGERQMRRSANQVRED